MSAIASYYPPPIGQTFDESQESMGLSAHERKSLGDQITREVRTAVDAAIEEAIDAFRPHGLRRAFHFLREWGLSGTLVMAPIALLALAGSGWWYALSRVEKQATFETETTDALKGIEEHLKGIDNALYLSQIQQAAENPEDKTSADAAKKAIDSARENAVRLTPSIVREAGQKFVQASNENPAAWDAALGFLNYKTFLNSASLLVPPNTGATFITNYNSVPLPQGEKLPQMSVAGVAPEESAARFDLIGHDANKGKPLGSKYIFTTGGAVVLDGMEFRDVIIRNAKVFYSGGPVQMKDVYFINCIFIMKSTPVTQNLALAMLEPHPATTFSGG